jgi:hypothetical protein
VPRCHHAQYRPRVDQIVPTLALPAAMGWLLNRPASHPDCAQRPVRCDWRRRSWRAAAGSAGCSWSWRGPGATRGHIGIAGRASRLARILSACNSHARNQSSHCEQSGYNFHFRLPRSMVTQCWASHTDQALKIAVVPCGNLVRHLAYEGSIASEVCRASDPSRSVPRVGVRVHSRGQSDG